MDTPSDRRLFGFCVPSALIGVPASVWLFPESGTLVLVIPVLILALLSFVDGYAGAA